MPLWLAADPLMLASKSVSRRAVLESAGIPIDIEPADVDEQVTAWLEHPDGRRGPVFPWARMGTVAVLRAAAEAGLDLTRQWRHANRAFVWVAARTASQRPA